MLIMMQVFDKLLDVELFPKSNNLENEQLLLMEE
jgi:hypothetical protein